MVSKRDCIKIATTPEHHAALVEAAKRENVSLNQYCLYLLALSLADEVEGDGFDDLFKVNDQGEVCQ